MLWISTDQSIRDIDIQKNEKMLPTLLPCPMAAKCETLETLARNTGIEGFDTNHDANRPSVTVRFS
jgi:hypothetical protein